MVAPSSKQIHNEILEQLTTEAWFDRRDPVIWPWKQKWIHRFLKRHADIWRELAKK